jgi:hypothetical protein
MAIMQAKANAVVGFVVIGVLSNIQANRLARL